MDDPFYFHTYLLANLLDLDKWLLFLSKAAFNLYCNHIKFYSKSHGRLNCDIYLRDASEHLT